jgi:hypothetical protein
MKFVKNSIEFVAFALSVFRAEEYAFFSPWIFGWVLLIPYAELYGVYIERTCFFLVSSILTYVLGYVS